MNASGPSARTATLLVAGLCLVWGSTWVVIAEGLDSLPAFTSAAIRFAVAAIAMVFVVRALAGREGGRAPPRGLVLSSGVLNFFGSYGAVYWSEQYLPSSLCSILYAVFTLLVAGFSRLLLPAVRISAKQVVGLVIGFAGVVLLFWTDVAALGDVGGAAALVFLISPLVSALGTVLVKKYGAGVNSLRLNRDGMAVGALLLAACALIGERDATIEWTPTAIASIAYLALIGTVFTFGVYFWLLRTLPAHKLAVIPYVTPVVAVLLGVALRDEAVHASTLIGCATILVGVVLTAR
ncbi:MAG: EamA family transporter [Planctomycetes bacterium]|nr:EamA family transporter [Planctomycetota bacterium]